MANDGIINLPTGNKQKVDGAKDAKWCHRFFVPMQYIEQGQDPIMKMGVQTIKAQISFVKCIADQCAIWDDKRKQCSEKTRNLAAADSADGTGSLTKAVDELRKSRENAMTLES